MVHGKDVFAFLDARFDQLASIVALKPTRQISGHWVASEVNERGVSLGLAGMETFQGDIQGIREIREALRLPGDHLGISPNPGPLRILLNSSFQARCEPGAEGFGVELIPHFDGQDHVNRHQNENWPGSGRDWCGSPPRTASDAVAGHEFDFDRPALAAGDDAIAFPGLACASPAVPADVGASASAGEPWLKRCTVVRGAGVSGTALPAQASGRPVQRTAPVSPDIWFAHLPAWSEISAPSPDIAGIRPPKRRSVHAAKRYAAAGGSRSWLLLPGSAPRPV